MNDIVLDFIDKLIENSEPLDTEIVEMVDNNIAKLLLDI